MLQSRIPVLAILALAAVACRDERRPTAPTTLETAVPLNKKGSAQAVVVLEPGATAESAVLSVRVLTKDMTLGAYQGTLTFDANAFEILETKVPSGSDAQFNIVNTDGAAQGVIRFAAFATEKFASNEAFRLTVKPRRQLSTVNFTTQLEVAGGTDGVALRESNLQASKGLRDALSGALISN